jgi:hypothetical protein
MPDIQAVAIAASVVDPELYVFGHPGSGYVLICTDPDLDPFINKQKR